jgi:excisionase family DNA binding protein
METTSSLLTREDLAEYLGVSVVTVDDWRRQGIGPVRMVLGKNLVRYRLEDVEEWLQSRRESSKAVS